MTKFAIQVPWSKDEQSGEYSDWMFVTKLVENKESECYPLKDIVVQTFDTIEDANENAKIWKVSKVVKYHEEEKNEK